MQLTVSVPDTWQLHWWILSQGASILVISPSHCVSGLPKCWWMPPATINRSKWRDEWVLHGWNGGAEKGAPHRVADMVDVERLAEASVDAGMSQRLLAVLSALEYRKPPIDEVFSLMT